MTTPRKPRVAVVYGFCEGPRLGRALRAALSRSGFAIAQNPNDAEAIIAHSSGCWMLPPDLKRQTVLLVGVPIVPNGQRLPLRFGPKIFSDFRAFKAEGQGAAWLAKTFWNGMYFWRWPRNVRMLRAHRRLTLPQNAGRLVVVRNRNDLFCTPDLAAMPKLSAAAFISLPGEHDDLWPHPARYVQLLNALLNAGDSPRQT